MPSQVTSLSLRSVALGIGFLLVALALIELGLYHPSTSALVATVLLAIAVTAHGVKPFGDSVAYYILQAATFSFWGIAMIVTVEVTIIATVFAVVGLIGVLTYGRQAVREGVWSAPQ